MPRNTSRRTTPTAGRKTQPPIAPKRKTARVSEAQRAINKAKNEQAIIAAAGSNTFDGSDKALVRATIIGMPFKTTDYAVTDTRHFGASSPNRILSKCTVELLQPSITDMAPSDTFLVTTGIACALPSTSSTNPVPEPFVPMCTRLTQIVPSNKPRWKTIFHCDYMQLYRAGIYPVQMDTDNTVFPERRAFSIQVNDADTGAATYSTVVKVDVELQMRVTFHYWDPVEETMSITLYENIGSSINSTTTSPPTVLISSGAKPAKVKALISIR